MEKQSKKKVMKGKRGITLIALVVTIIVLLILAGISIGMLSGNNGILKESRNTKKETGIAQLVESAKLDVFAQITENNGEDISKDQLKTILNKYFEDIDTLELPDDLSNSDIKLKANEANGGYENIALVNIYNGQFTTGKTSVEKVISKEESFVGCYADIDGNGTVDGVIYVDLLLGIPAGPWVTEEYSWCGEYELPTDVTVANVKDYVKSENPVTDARFDSTARYVVSPSKKTSGTKDRFYVMGLNDITDGTNTRLYWYYSAYIDDYHGAMTDYQTYTSADFGAGKANTTAMLTKWNAGGYGTKNDRDLWKWIDVGQGGANEGWFVPSRGEWAAFCKAFDLHAEIYDENWENVIEQANYTDFGLNNAYWCSSQCDQYCANGAGLYGCFIYDVWRVYMEEYVRLSTTF